MPIDPQVQAVLDQLNAAGSPPFTEMTVAEARAASMTAFADLVGAPEAISSVVNRFIPGPTSDLPVRIYVPEQQSRPSGALVYFHGSGWVVQNIDVSDAPARAVANRTGCTVIAVNYQKAPEHKFPVPFDDAYAAVTWVAEHADELSIDPQRIGVMGDSAGGNLAAAVCLKAQARGTPAIACQVLIYPATDFGWDKPSAIKNAEGLVLERSTMQWFWSHYLASDSEADNPFVSPLRAPSLAGLPPAFIVTAEFDPLCDDGELYGERLRQAGVPVKVHRYEGVTHGFFWMSGVVDQSRQLIDEIGAEVRAIFGAREGKSEWPAPNRATRAL